MDLCWVLPWSLALHTCKPEFFRSRRRWFSTNVTRHLLSSSHSFFFAGEFWEGLMTVWLVPHWNSHIFRRLHRFYFCNDRYNCIVWHCTSIFHVWSHESRVIMRKSITQTKSIVELLTWLTKVRVTNLYLVLVQNQYLPSKSTEVDSQHWAKA